MTRLWVPYIRRAVQLTGVLALLMMPLFALYLHYKQARAIGDLPEDWRGLAVRSIDQLVGDSEERLQAVSLTQGTLWSARIFGVSLTDPLAGAEALVTRQTFYVPFVLSLVIPAVASLLLGRVFCAWVCPMNAWLELVDKARGLLGFLELRPRDKKFSLWNKYFLLATGLGLAAVSGVPFLAMIHPPALLSREFHSLVFGAGLGIGIYIVVAITAVELLVSRRWWCRYVCPGGALYSFLGRFRLVRVRRDVAKCTECGDCVRVCQFGLKPMLVKTTGMECTNCAACIAGCGSKALSYTLVVPLPVLDGRNGNGTSKPSRLRSRTAVGRVTGLSIAMLVSLLLPPSAVAHHILGLPHYSYKDNYPQVPTLEYPATTGPYDVLMTSYPGKPTPGEAATVAFYIKDHNSGKPYGHPVTVQVLKTSTFGSSSVVYPPATHEPFDNQHKYTISFPKDGEYVVELTLEVEGRQEVIPFLVVAGEPTATKSVMLTLVLGLGVFLVAVRAIKVKRNRRNARRGSGSDTAMNGLARPVAR